MDHCEKRDSQMVAYSQKILIALEDFRCIDCSIRVTALLGYLDLVLLSGDARTLTNAWSSLNFTNFKYSMHPTGLILAFFS